MMEEILKLQEIQNKLKKILFEVIDLGFDDYLFSIEDDIFELGIGSIDIIRYIVAIEEAFGFEFDDEELAFSRFNNIKNLSLYVATKITE